MPLEDAIALVVRSFEQYRQTLPLEQKTAFIPPDRNTLYLLNLLADNRFLTVDELREVVDYLEDRSDRLIEAQGGVPPKKKLHLQAKVKEELQPVKQESLQKPLPATTGPRQQLMDVSPKRAMPEPSPAPYSQTPSSFQAQGANSASLYSVQGASAYIGNQAQNAYAGTTSAQGGSAYAVAHDPPQRNLNASQYANDTNTAPGGGAPRAQQQQAPATNTSHAMPRPAGPLFPITNASRYSESNNAPSRHESYPQAEITRNLGPEVQRNAGHEVQRNVGSYPASAGAGLSQYPSAAQMTRPQNSAPSTTAPRMPNVSIASVLNSKSINFDNPMVQSALDNLISSGSSLFKNIPGMQFQPRPAGAGASTVAGGGNQDTGRNTTGGGNAGMLAAGDKGKEKGPSYSDWDKFVSNLRANPEKY